TTAAVEQMLQQLGNGLPPQVGAEIRYVLGMIYLRHGETQNCCLLHNKDSCLLPIHGGGIHTRVDGSRAAIEHPKLAVALAEPNSRRYYEAVWLWNIASMTLGEHPDGVPPPHRMERDRFLSKEKFPRLMNIAPELGLDTNSLCGSVVADDFNGDGYLDLMVSSWDLRDDLRLYFYRPAEGRFADVTGAAGLNGLPGGLNMVQADYNNDGRIDVYVMRGAWLFAAGRHPDSLLRNNGDGTFTDVTHAAGLAEFKYPGQTASWSDYDLDGWLDLYVGGESTRQSRAPCRLYHNNRDGTFTDVADRAGVANGHLTKGVTWGDYDGDRYPDLYVSNLGSNNRLYRNNGDGTFADVAEQAGVANLSKTFPTWFWDYNNDGILDLFVASFDTGIEDVAKYYLQRPVDHGFPRIFRGTESGQFVDMTRELGFVEPTLPMGSNFGDLDNDGYLDIYLGTGSPEYSVIIPNKMYLNRKGDSFVDISEAAGLSHLQKGHGVAFADLDADGDRDIFIQMGGAYTVDKYVDALYENPGFGNSWVWVELVGVKSNRFGVGSKIRVDVEEQGRTRSIYRWVNSGGSFGCNPLRQEIGLGKAERIVSLEVYWPLSDQSQAFSKVPMRQVVRVTEGNDELVVTGLAPTEFAR
ncbi:MAG: CRTAC1 family protein, partial [Planctomycetales bacterium]|nr:CRTAC1 family protein [Planctomycetales bacterium]